MSGPPRTNHACFDERRTSGNAVEGSGEHSFSDTRAEIVLGMFDVASGAMAALHALQENGFDSGTMGLIANNVLGECDRYLGNSRKDGRCEVVATTGSLGPPDGEGRALALGGAGSSATRLCTMVIPPIGPVLVAGTIVADMIRGPGGVIVRRTRVVLLNAGVSHALASKCEEGVRRGGALLFLRPAHRETVGEARQVLRSHGHVDIDVRARAWREAGWYEFEPEEEPYTRDEIMRERQRHGVRLPEMTGRVRARGPRGTKRIKRREPIHRDGRDDRARVAATSTMTGRGEPVA